MKKIIKLNVLLVLFFTFINVNAQITVSHEVGVFLGPTFMQTDYGEAEKFDSSINNTGFGFGVAYIADFSDSRSSSTIGRTFSEHVKLRAELSYIKANFAYDGKPVETPSAEQDRFRAMKGSTKMLNLGVFAEVYIFNLADRKKLQPYVLLGGSYTSAKPTLKSALPLPSIYLPEEDNVFLDAQTVFSFTGGLGARYQLDEIDIVFEYRYQHFSSDRLEGLEADFSGNKNNDAQGLFNIGVVFNLDY